VLGIHRLPPPTDPSALPGVVFGHLLHELLKDAHPPPLLEAFVDHAGGDPKPVFVERLPLASRPKHVPDGVDDGAIRCPWSATSSGHLCLLGQALLEFPPQGAGKMEVVYLPLCGSLSHKRHLL
jgi:hypothetical protein